MSLSGFVKRTHPADAAYAQFEEDLAEPLRTTAKRLTKLFVLAPEGVAWSQVFPHEFTLAAPALLANALGSAWTSRLRTAVLLHMMAVLEGVSHDRITAGRISMTPELERFWRRVHALRDEAISRMSVFVCSPESSFDLAFHRYDLTIAIERPLLDALEPADFALYDRINTARQALHLPACESVAQAAGWSPSKRRDLREMLTTIGAGLQMYGNVVDWEDAQIHGGTWAVLLAKELLRRTSIARPDVPSTTRAQVLESGVLALLLERAHQRLAAARAFASALGLRYLARWAAVQSLALDDLSRAERAYPGYAVRAKALRPWVETVLT